MMTGVQLRVSQDRPFFPILLNIEGQKCVVVGAGKIAAGKIAGLLNYGAKIVVVSPRATRQIKDQARAGVLTWHQRRFLPRDIQGAFLVIAATNSSEVNGTVFRACRARRVLCNAVDDPEHCDFFYPAVVRRGLLQIAISTNGRAPALASRLRRELEEQFGHDWSSWVEHVGKLRREILEQELPAETRRQRLLQLASSEAFRSFVRKRAKQTSPGSRSAKPRRN
jgi:precorrin-2 dehydrogenase / sirohydrochlorin ferrochelatase